MDIWASKKTSHIKHDQKVKDVQDQVENWRNSGCDQPMCTARPGWKSISLQKPLYKDRMYQIKIDLGDIIKIDMENKTVQVEPMVSIGNLNDFLIGKGWTLPIVPELDDLTIGGLVMGGGIESTSHKYGLFSNICRAYQLVLGDGSAVWCSPAENEDLFLAVPFSYGTLGFLTCVDIDIIPYKPYIKLTYHNVKSMDEAVEKFKEVTKDPDNDSVEGIMYSLDTGVIMSGKFVHRVPPRTKYNPLNRWYKPWFYTYVETYLDEEKQKVGNVEYIPTDDFYHRHNKAYYWLMGNSISFANNVLFRYLFGWTMPIRFSLLKWLGQRLTPPEAHAKLVLQDYILKLDHLKETLAYIHQETKVYPIWLCPTKRPEAYDAGGADDLYVDIGVYGDSPIEGFNLHGTQRKLEQFTSERNGLVALYAETQLTFEEYKTMFREFLEKYDKAREMYKCERAFPHVYEKISKLGRSSV